MNAYKKNDNVDSTPNDGGDDDGDGVGERDDVGDVPPTPRYGFDEFSWIWKTAVDDDDEEEEEEMM